MIECKLKSEVFIELNEQRLDVLTELINMGIGRAASVMNQMLTQKVQLQPPSVKLMSLAEFLSTVQSQSKEYSTVKMDFSGMYNGSCALIFPPQSAANLVSVLVGEEEATNELNSVKSSTLSEVGNIVINSVLGSLAKNTNNKFDYSLPIYKEGDIKSFLLLTDKKENMNVLMVRTQFVVSSLKVTGEMTLVFSADSMPNLAADLDRLLSNGLT